jgi:hypothetical protein
LKGTMSEALCRYRHRASLRPPLRVGPVRSALSATPKTVCGAGSRSSTGYWPPKRASPWPSRSSRATPVALPRSPPRCKS